MEKQLKELFLSQWRTYFGETELPIAFFYTDEVSGNDLSDTKNEHMCLIGNLNRVREGHAFVYDAKSPGCPGGKRYTGFLQKLRPNFEYFLSCGIPGQMEGERYKKSPELVKEHLKNHPPFEAPGQYLVFKRWDKLAAAENPLAVIFFAAADVLSGLFTLANFDAADAQGVIAPFGSGCSSIVNYPLVESKFARPRCILGMFDVSARPSVPQDMLTFAVPMKRFEEMISNMGESFLITKSWAAVRKRINPTG
ncbi:MAG: DUF169 domain-containing protein [Dehalococcoidia bacterium]|nr:DUF169 domain-containing protein [Dehalococcoidia bacterium]